MCDVTYALLDEPKQKEVVEICNRLADLHSLEDKESEFYRRISVKYWWDYTPYIIESILNTLVTTPNGECVIPFMEYLYLQHDISENHT